MEIFGSVELGGTKTLVAVGTAEGTLGEVSRLDTGDDPGATVGRVVDFLAGRGVEAVGIASFGPLQLNRGRTGYGTIQSTPKAGWSGYDLLGEVGSALGVPVAIDTDVNAAALAEGELGRSRGLAHHAYMTIGTGIGVGLVRDGEVVGGLSHPEAGHIAVDRLEGDRFPGTCPFHGDCVEGMVAGPAMLKRFGKTTSELSHEHDQARRLLGHYLGQAIRALVYTVSPERVVVGGGVSKTSGFHRAVHQGLVESMAGYGVQPEHADPEFVSAPGLGELSGLVGGVLLARRALGSA